MEMVMKDPSDFDPHCQIQYQCLVCHSLDGE